MVFINLQGWDSNFIQFFLNGSKEALGGWSKVHVIALFCI